MARDAGVLPEHVAAVWQRMADDELIMVGAGDQLASGAYRLPDGLLHASIDAGSNNQDADDHGQPVLLLRAANQGWASALAGVPVAAVPRQRAAQAMALRSLDPWSLAVATWRLADGEAWPWLGLEGGFASLPWLCERVNVRPWRYDETMASYVSQADANAASLTVAAVATDTRFRTNTTTRQADAEIDTETLQNSSQMRVAYGDLLTAVEQRDHAVVSVFTADRGTMGRLDPADLVTTAQHADGTLRRHVAVVPLGSLLTPDDEVFAYRRDPARREKLSRHLPSNSDKPQTLYGLLVTLPSHRQWMVVAALGIGSLLMLRSIRKYRRRQRKIS